ncbi:hypothetical protein CH380_09550 [Leptospira adleri]|uniref:Uncharacterized protein n=1 Tax=Leptospira adleri TaxID=2023186 RepID=A0A2M9YPG8_9LEPT|nr:hypothetical protein CH380_09550 [Leptospira adleri]PJZ63013.1 hypothetical protein CH376_04910 [Leptospira adleri]
MFAKLEFCDREKSSETSTTRPSTQNRAGREDFTKGRSSDRFILRSKIYASKGSDSQGTENNNISA